MAAETVPYQKAVERTAIRKASQLTADEAIQKILADRRHASQHTGAHYTEHHAVELLVKAGWEREKAERAVRERLY